MRWESDFTINETYAPTELNLDLSNVFGFLEDCITSDGIVTTDAISERLKETIEFLKVPIQTCQGTSMSRGQYKQMLRAIIYIDELSILYQFSRTREDWERLFEKEVAINILPQSAGHGYTLHIKGPKVLKKYEVVKEFIVRRRINNSVSYFVAQVGNRDKCLHVTSPAVILKDMQKSSRCQYDLLPIVKKSSEAHYRLEQVKRITEERHTVFDMFTDDKIKINQKRAKKVREKRSSKHVVLPNLNDFQKSAIRGLCDRISDSSPIYEAVFGPPGEINNFINEMLDILMNLL